jgi:very-short-patch-repair endonuclease
MRPLDDILPDADGRPYLPTPDAMESWLEDRFAWQAIKYMRPEIDLRPQVSVDTSAGRFRLDFLTAGYRVNLAFECDGAAYHRSPEHEAWRDQLILQSGAVWGIYHLPYRDLVEWPEWCFLAIARRHYDLFRDGALLNLKTLAQGVAPRLGVTYRCQP